MKNQFIYFIIFVAMLYSCNRENEQNYSKNKPDKFIKIEQDSVLKNNTAKSIEKYYKLAIPQMVKSLKHKDYKFPTHEEFRNKILEIASIDIDTVSREIIYTIAWNTDAILNENFFLPLIDQENVLATIEYNNMIMYDKPTDYFFRDQSIVLQYITMSGYTKSEELLKKAFGQAEGDEKAICYLLFNYPDTSMGIPRNQPFRYDMLLKMVQFGRELLTNLPTRDFKQYQLPKDEYYKALCYLLNAECSIHTQQASGVWMEYPYGARTDSYFIDDPEIRLAFKKNNYWRLNRANAFKNSTIF
jgi:hypothetical protein